MDIEVTGDEEAERKLRALGSFLHDLRPFWPLVVPLFVRWEALQFGSEGAFGGAAWAPLSASYLAEKARRYPGQSILMATGQLRRAASSPSRNASATSLTLTVEDRTVGWHQDGTTKMPARPVVPDPLPAAALSDLDQAAERYVGDIVRRLGL